MLKKEVCTIVLTGGPCAGKTTALSWISNYYTKLGWKVLVANEAATEIFTSGYSPLDFRNPLYFQEMLIRTQLYKEHMAREAAIASDCEKVLIVCDRGVYDNKAYVDPLSFEKVINRIGRNEVLEAVHNYDGIFHLVTTADGAEEFYTCANNEARSEGLEEARKLDCKTQNAWVGHPHLRIITNEGSFEDKLKELLTHISVILGEPSPYEIERKYLIEMPKLDYLRSLPNCKEVEVLQTYLNSANGDEVRVRQRGTEGDYIFTKTIKRKTDDPAKRVEIEERISRDEYLRLLMDAIPGPNSIRKKRFCVMQRESGQYLEIDVYPTCRNYAILEVEFTSSSAQLVAPDFLKIIKEVTDDDRYYNMRIAMNGNCLPEEDLPDSDDDE